MARYHAAKAVADKNNRAVKLCNQFFNRTDIVFKALVLYRRFVFSVPRHIRGDDGVPLGF